MAKSKSKPKKQGSVVKTKSKKQKKSTVKVEPKKHTRSKKINIDKIDVFFSSNGPPIESYPEIIDFINEYPKKRCLLFKNDCKGLFRELTGIMQILTSKNHFEKLLNIEDCSTKKGDDLYIDIVKNKLDNIALALHNVSKENSESLAKMTTRFLQGVPPLVLIGLKLGEDESFLSSGLLHLCKVVSLLKIEFDDALSTIIINGDSLAIKPKRNYEFLKLLYDNRTRYINKDKIAKDILKVSDYDDQAIFNMRTESGKEIERYGLRIECRTKEGYRLIM